MRPVTLGAVLISFAALSGCSRHPAPETAEPNDVVEIGYGKQQSREVTGAISSITNNREASVRHARVEEMIRGRVPGVQVLRKANGDYSIRIRDGANLVGSGEPLIVVDGMPISEFAVAATLSGIAPNDVARIDVLRDAGAAAIYGSRGGNGVIVITTRRTN